MVIVHVSLNMTEACGPDSNCAVSAPTSLSQSRWRDPYSADGSTGDNGTNQPTFLQTTESGVTGGLGIIPGWVYGKSLCARLCSGYLSLWALHKISTVPLLIFLSVVNNTQLWGIVRSRRKGSIALCNGVAHILQNRGRCLAYSGWTVTQLVLWTFLWIRAWLRGNSSAEHWAKWSVKKKTPQEPNRWTRTEQLFVAGYNNSGSKMPCVKNLDGVFKLPLTVFVICFSSMFSFNVHHPVYIKRWHLFIFILSAIIYLNLLEEESYI